MSTISCRKRLQMTHRIGIRTSLDIDPDGLVVSLPKMANQFSATPTLPAKIRRTVERTTFTNGLRDQERTSLLVDHRWANDKIGSRTYCSSQCAQSLLSAQLLARRIMHVYYFNKLTIVHARTLALGGVRQFPHKP